MFYTDFEGSQKVSEDEVCPACRGVGGSLSSGYETNSSEPCHSGPYFPYEVKEMDATQLKTIRQIPQVPMDCWQVAEHLFGKDAVNQDHLLAGKAATQMKVAGWTFLEYDPVYGEEIWQPVQSERENNMICKNCEHWFDDPGQIQIAGRGICLKANCVQRDDRRTLGDEGSQAHALTTVASAFGYEMAINQLETTAAFGCNQFEEKNEAFMTSVRCHEDLIETTAAQFQIVREYAAGVDFRYARTIEEAEMIKNEFVGRGPHTIGRNNNRLSVEIFERGEFVPHYKHDE